MHLKIDKKGGGGVPKMTSLLVIVRHCWANLDIGCASLAFVLRDVTRFAVLSTRLVQ